jgi:hypothetical protein
MKSLNDIESVKQISLFTLTHLQKVRDRYNWNRTSENYERIYLKKTIFFSLNLAFGQVGEKNEDKDCNFITALGLMTKKVLSE